MTVYEKIEKIFSQESDDKPKWADEILQELREIKTILQREQNKKHHDYTFYNFVNSFRKKMMPDAKNNVYPEVEYQGKK